VAAPPPADYSKAKSNPFGQAKPRDEAAILRKKQEESKSTEEANQTANRFANLSTGDQQ
jgi:hypothetical protein